MFDDSSSKPQVASLKRKPAPRRRTARDNRGPAVSAVAAGQTGGVRTDVTRGEIVAHLRRRITSGELAPGSRLPTYRGLQSLLQANMVTVGRAIDQLKGEGFIDTQGARGTFVVDHPPHLFRYALIFPSHPSEANWPRFWEALAKEAATIERDGPCELPIYYDVDQISHPGSASYTKLVDDVRAHRFAGLIFATDPWVVRDTPLLSEPGMPCVSITRPQPVDYPNLATVCLDTEGLFHKALDYLVAQGRKRLAVLTVPTEIDRLLEVITREALRRGLEIRPYWLQAVSPTEPRSAQACMHLLMHGGQSQRPDALFVTDDNLVEYAIAGLVDAGVRVPTDVDVVVHCNFPWPTPSVVPVRRIGFDADQLLAACIKNIDQQRQSGRLPVPVTVPALFEDELGSPPTQSSSQLPTRDAEFALPPSRPGNPNLNRRNGGSVSIRPIGHRTHVEVAAVPNSDVGENS